MLLLQNVERGSQMMTRVRGTESARIQHQWRDHRNASNHSNKGDDRWHSKIECVWSDEIRSPRTESHAQPLLTVGDPSSNGTNMFIIRSGRHKEIQFEKLVIQSIFPIEMILNKYFLENPSSEKLSKYPPSTTPNHRFLSDTHINAHHGTRRKSITTPQCNGFHFISFHFNRKLLLSLTLHTVP